MEEPTKSLPSPRERRAPDFTPGEQIAERFEVYECFEDEDGFAYRALDLDADRMVVLRLASQARDTTDSELPMLIVEPAADSDVDDPFFAQRELTVIAPESGRIDSTDAERYEIGPPLGEHEDDFDHIEGLDPDDLLALEERPSSGEADETSEPTPELLVEAPSASEDPAGEGPRADTASDRKVEAAVDETLELDWEGYGEETETERSSSASSQDRSEGKDRRHTKKKARPRRLMATLTLPAAGFLAFLALSAQFSEASSTTRLVIGLAPLYGGFAMSRLSAPKTYANFLWWTHVLCASGIVAAHAMGTIPLAKGLAAHPSWFLDFAHDIPLVSGVQNLVNSVCIAYADVLHEIIPYERPF